MRRRSLPTGGGPPLRGLPERAYLTVTAHGWRELAYRLVTSPLRLVGLEGQLRKKLLRRAEVRQLRRWYEANWRPVTVVVPSYGDPGVTIEAVRSLRRTLDPARTRIVVVDDASAEEHQQRLRALEGAEVVLASENGGYSASVNRGLERAGDQDDLVVLNNDVVARPYWLEALQRAAHSEDPYGAGIVGPRLLYPDGRIQSAGSYRNLGAPEWFDHRYRFKPAADGPAAVAWPALAVTGACMYIRRDVLDELGPFDDGYRMGFEDVDYCLRAWQEGFGVRYEPASVLTHVESPTRGTEVGDRERSSQQRFWERWGGWLDGRDVRTPEGALRVIYVTEDTGVGGGHRDVFEHLNRLQERGHSVALYSLGGAPEWFALDVPVHTFASYEELSAALEPEKAIKIATWWRTAEWVWRASVRNGLPVYFVQDIETSYYSGNEAMRHRVLASYRQEFQYMTISQWNAERLRELGLEAAIVPPGIDLEVFRPLAAQQRSDAVLAVGRSNPLKNLPLTVDAWRRLAGPELWMFGIEPELGDKYGARYWDTPSDTGVNELLNQAAVFVQTSRHEGFCLPPLEAMAAGTPVVCTDAHGNRDFCTAGENCLMPEAHPDAVAGALRSVLNDAALRQRLVEAGLRTAREYSWERRIDSLEQVLEGVAERSDAAAAT
ncbi:MAG: glycosyltransferase [Thermoleophilaceae bacterium]